MTSYRFPYASVPHPLFGSVSVPLITLELYSQPLQRWMKFSHVLADTGADLSVVRRIVGRTIVGDYRSGSSMGMEGIIGHQALLRAFIHRVQARVGRTVFELPIAVADSNDIELIFGRYQALDRFTARFVSGTELIIET